MPEYLSPGVYVEEVATGPRPIEGVSTSTAGFAGVTERGPMIPRLVTSWSDFQRWFGSYVPRDASYLPYAVQGFFENGGQRVFIARVVSRTDHKGSTDFPAPAGPTPVAAANVLAITAIGPGGWGANLFIDIRNASLFDPASAATRDLFRLRVFYFAAGVPALFIDPTVNANLANPFRREPDVIEDYDNLSADPSSADYVVNVVNARSRLVQLDWGNTHATKPPGVPARPANRGADDTARATLDTASANVKVVVTARGPGEWGNAIHVTVEAPQGTPPTFLVKVVHPNRSETFSDLTAATVLGVINAGSQLVRAEWDPPHHADIPKVPTPIADHALKGGHDFRFAVAADANPQPVRPLDYLGNPAVPVNQRIGLAGLEAIDEISILCVPDEARETTDQITNAVIDQCERLRDRFAIVSIKELQSNVAGINPPRDTTYGAVYYPWIRIYDPRTQTDFTVPPTGHVAGIYARTDVERGVHKAPANEVVRGIVTRDLGTDRKPLEFTIGKGEHDILNPRGVDVIRDFRAQGRGIRVWGARTMSTDAQWKYVNVRRLFIFVEESIDEGTQWVVFEPNDENTWSSVRRSIGSFLTRVWKSGALFGTTADEAFFVKCDRTTMTQDDIDNGRLICLIGIAPVKPAEFVIFRISQKTAEAPA